MMKVMIGCGGTGGHITPAIAIADLIREREADSEILFLGAVGGMEERMVPCAGYDFEGLHVKGLTRRICAENLKALSKMKRATDRAAQRIREFSPDIVIGTGGYASFPALCAAIRCGVSCAVHESNALPGLVVRVLAPRLDRVWLNFDVAAKRLSARAHTRTVGMPQPSATRESVPVHVPRAYRHTVLSFGGSLGARALNRAVLDLMEAERARGDVYHIHATGEREYASFCEEFAARGLTGLPHLRIEPFLSPMASFMAVADVVISRAGAASISELAALSKPAILIPSPNVTGNHQLKNASALSSCGAAILIEESPRLGDALTHAVFELLDNRSQKERMARAISDFSHPHANEEIWEDILMLLAEKGRQTV